MTLAAPVACPVCGRPPRRSHRLRNGHVLLQCPRCLLGWWDWPPFDPREFYDESYFQSPDAPKGYADYASLEAGICRTARARLKRIGRLLRADRSRPRRLLEIGCGTGLFLEEAARAGWSCEGIEASAYAVGRARERRLRVTHGAVEGQAIPRGEFDCIALWDVIEHIRDPAGAIRSAAGGLRPGGVLALSTGDVTSLCARISGAAWHLFNLPEHLFFFSPGSLNRLVTQAGLRTAQLSREANWVPVSYLIERLVKPLGGRAPRALSGGAWVVPATLLDVLGLYAVREPCPTSEDCTIPL